MADATTNAVTAPTIASKDRSMPAAIAIALLASGAIGTVAWCGIIAYGTLKLLIG